MSSPPSLDSLPLTRREREVARDKIAKMAYKRWEDAGRPDGRAAEFWREAEQEWIHYQYGPGRYPNDREEEE